jgi:hypothetical protein
MFTLLFLYSVILLVLVIGAFFIVYHILRFSLTLSLGYFGAVLFGVVFVFLTAINFISFQSLESEALFPELEALPLLELPAATVTHPARNPW